MREESPRWGDLFVYRDGDLYWRHDRCSTVRAGDRAGFTEPGCGYRRVSIGQKGYYVHRIIWEMHNGPIPSGMQVDHVNHARDDNHLHNLRLVTPSRNVMNASLSARNTSGVTGVSFDKSARRWYAHMRVDGVILRQQCASFEDAVDLRRSWEREVGFHPNHGKPRAAPPSWPRRLTKAERLAQAGAIG